ncbi:MAG: pilus assembly protein [Alphaproteobacteria bacterium]|nr:pilus assembly protein [Alphaproteobacteria bacterium]
MRRRIERFSPARLLRDKRGGILVEFAMAMPVLLILLIGGVELGRYVLLNQKLDRTVMTISDIVASSTTVTTAEIDQIFDATGLILEPFPFGAEGTVVISSVRRQTGSPKVIWQRSGAGSLSVTSLVGVQGGNATLSDNDLVDNSQAIIIGEVFYQYTPWFTDLIPSSIIRHQSAFRPRQSNEVVCSDC